MSTDIVKFPSNDSGQPHKVYSSEALLVWLVTTLPLMALTFAGYYLYQWINRRGRRKWDLDLLHGA